MTVDNRRIGLPEKERPVSIGAGTESRPARPPDARAKVNRPIDKTRHICGEGEETRQNPLHRRDFLRQAGIGAATAVALSGRTWPAALRTAIDNTEPTKITQIDAVSFADRGLTTANFQNTRDTLNQALCFQA
jgi:hypothetical protein